VQFEEIIAGLHKCLPDCWLSRLRWRLMHPNNFTQILKRRICSVVLYIYFCFKSRWNKDEIWYTYGGDLGYPRESEMQEIKPRQKKKLLPDIYRLPGTFILN
jgi:hypothetical protein